MKNRFIYNEKDATGITIYPRSEIHTDKQEQSSDNSEAGQSENVPPLVEIT